LDRPELNERQAVMRPVHGLLGPDQGVKVENPKFSLMKRYFQGVTRNRCVVADASNFAESLF
jgi:hypothetical protein